MPTTPTSKSQVQAYRFVLKRMESALTRKDPVLTHDPMRTHGRAAATGVILGTVGLIGFLIAGVFNPKGDIPSDGIVISKNSGSVYVVGRNPTRMIPMLNLASAKLLLISQGGGQTGSGQTEFVDDSRLNKAPRDRLTGIPGAPDWLPGPEQRAGADWAVCDTTAVDETTAGGADKARPKTTVLVDPGVDRGRARLAAKQALLVRVATGKRYLVYTIKDGHAPNNSTTVRAEIDTNDSRVRAAFNLNGVKPRPISVGTLNAIREVRPLIPPEIPDRGNAPGYNAGGQVIGGVVKSESTSGTQYFVVLSDGLKPVSPAAADLIREAAPTTGRGLINISAQLSSLAMSKQDISFDEFPEQKPEIINLAGGESENAVCLNWSGVSGRESTFVSVHDKLPLPRGTGVLNNQEISMNPVVLGQADNEEGERLDAFFMPPGRGAVVRSVNSGDAFSSGGELFLVNDRGVRFGIPNAEIADKLGLGGPFTPAPAFIMALLPEGPRMEPEAARRTFDTVPVDESGPIVRQPKPSQHQAP